MATESSEQSRGSLILLYHRVADLPTDPHRLSVKPERFAAHLQIINQFTHPTPLPDLASAMTSSERPRVAVTFDDGYLDNLENAKPLLVRYGVPATVFVATRGLTAPHEYFWDELDAIFLQPGALPAHLEITIGGETITRDLGPSATYDEAAYAQHRAWHMGMNEFPTSRQELYSTLWRKLLTQPSAERDRVMAEIRRWAGLESAAVRATHRMMTPSQVRQLADGGVVSVGAHTVSHPRLSAEAPPRQLTELRESRATLEQVLGRPVKTFAYPFGTRADYTPDSVAAARSAGFDLAVSNFGGAVTPATSPYELPRLATSDQDAATFESTLRAWITKYCNSAA